MKASELATVDPFFHIALTGPSGAGKTSWSALAPRPWIITSEANAIQSIRKANPDALITQVRSWKEFDRCISAVMRGTPHEYPDGQRGLQVTMKWNGAVETFDFQTLVVDSMTAMSDFLFLHMQGGGERVNRIGDPDSDEYDLTLQQRGRIGETLEAVIREQRDSFRCNTIFQFLPDVRDESEDMRAVYPLVSGKKTGPKIVSFFNGAAWIDRQTMADGTNAHTITFNKKGSYPTKLPPGFPAGKFVIPEGRSGYGLGAFAKAALPEVSTPTAPWDNVDEIRALLKQSATTPQEPEKKRRNRSEDDDDETETTERPPRSRRGNKE